VQHNQQEGGRETIVVSTILEGVLSGLERASTMGRIVLGLDDNDGKVCLIMDPGGSHVKKNTSINLDDCGRQSGLPLNAPLYLALVLFLPWVLCLDTVVRRMLKVVNLGPDNVHVDLGCGDRRFNFTQSTNRSMLQRVGGWTMIQTYC
jgi:hypothetical protein